MKQIINYKRAVIYLDNIFDLCNKKYFESAISKPVITIMSTKGKYGHVSNQEIWREESKNVKELNLGAGTLDRPIVNIVCTMLHEMCHLYNAMNGVKDTSRGFTYHNEKFKASAEKVGLKISHDPKHGWTITEPTQSTIDFCQENKLDDIQINRNEGDAAKKGKKQSSTRKYICTSCGASVRATKELNILCGDCKTPMVRA